MTEGSLGKTVSCWTEQLWFDLINVIRLYSIMRHEHAANRWRAWKLFPELSFPPCQGCYNVQQEIQFEDVWMWKDIAIYSTNEFFQHIDLIWSIHHNITHRTQWQTKQFISLQNEISQFLINLAKIENKFSLISLISLRTIC